jgi:hypothetical protein
VGAPDERFHRPLVHADDGYGERRRQHEGVRKAAKLTSEATTTSPVRSISSLPELIRTEMWPGV